MSTTTSAVDPRRTAIESIVGAALQRARTSSGVRLAALGIVTLPDGSTVTVRSGNTGTADGWFAAAAERLEADGNARQLASDSSASAGSTVARDEAAAADAAEAKRQQGIDDVCASTGRHIAAIVNACEMCDAMQRARVNLHDLISAMKERTLHRSRDWDVSRSALDGSVPIMAGFPSELWRRVGEFLPEWDLLQLPAVAPRAFVARDDLVWGTLYERFFPLPPVPLPAGVTWRDLFLKNVRYVDSRGSVPHLSTFLADVCSTGSVSLGTERMQIVDFSPSVFGIPQRRGGHNEARLEAFAVHTARGPVVITVALVREPDGPRANMKLVGHVRTSIAAKEIKALFRSE